jgi:hypothetical protein
LRDLPALLAAHHGERVVIIIDQHDVPNQCAFSRGFFDTVVVFLQLSVQ